MAYSGYEAAALADSATAVASAPALSLMGYASAPAWSSPENTADIDGVGYAGDFGYKKGRREPTMSGSLLFTGALGCKNLLRSALRYDTTLASARVNCLPLVSLLTGYAGTCGGSVEVVSGRYGMMEQATVTWAEGQIVRMSYQAQMLTLTTATTFAAPTPAAIIAAGGVPYAWHECAWTIQAGGVGTSGLDNILSSATLTISNVIQRDGTRPDTGDSDPMSRAAYGMTAMKQSIRFEATTKNLPAYCDSISCVMSDVGGTPAPTIITMSGVTRDSSSQSQTQSDGRFEYPSSFKVAFVSIS